MKKSSPYPIRNRVKELRHVRAGDLRENPLNWRTHPVRQRRLLSGILQEIGYADALIARELPDGGLELIDGHLRAETTPEMEVPVLVVDLSEEESRRLLLVLDPVSAIAETDESKLESLVCSLDFEDEELRRFVESGYSGAYEESVPASTESPEKVDHPIPECFQVVAECPDEDSQRALYERLCSEGYHCRLLML
ncbi:MAG: hypothetical protein Q4C47_03915 [Planctomycetia bacterium]|nr:hypothetical protein [Planctomycetia bacterium]